MIANDLRVLVVGASPLARAGVTALLSERANLSIVGQTACDDSFQQTVAAYRPDVLVWDFGWNPEDELTRLSEIEASLPPTLALLSDETQAASLLAAGVQALLLSDSDAEMIAAALVAVAQGLVAISPELTTLALTPQTQKPAVLEEPLTPREQEVLNLLAEGLPNKTIALKLGISEHTVKFHVNAIMSKLGVQSRTEAVVQATRLGLIVL